MEVLSPATETTRDPIGSQSRQGTTVDILDIVLAECEDDKKFAACLVRTLRNQAGDSSRHRLNPGMLRRLADYINDRDLSRVRGDATRKHLVATAKIVYAIDCLQKEANGQVSRLFRRFLNGRSAIGTFMSELNELGQYDEFCLTMAELGEFAINPDTAIAK